jgi:hypothetical protein
MLAFSNMSQVIYARVPDALKEAADTYASERGTTLTGAVVELLQRGLAAVSDEQSIGDLQANLARAVAEKAQLKFGLMSAHQELAVLKTFAQRANSPVGTCPNAECGQEISGYDLLGVGRCRHCAQQLTSLVAPASHTSTLDQREVMVLLGALGAVLAISYLAGQ